MPSACHPGIQEVGQEESKFKDSPGYIESLRLSWAMWQDPCFVYMSNIDLLHMYCIRGTLPGKGPVVEWKETVTVGICHRGWSEVFEPLE